MNPRAPPAAKRIGCGYPCRDSSGVNILNLQCDDISEKTSGHGVVIDGLNIKDAGIVATTFSVSGNIALSTATGTGEIYSNAADGLNLNGLVVNSIVPFKSKDTTEASLDFDVGSGTFIFSGAIISMGGLCVEKKFMNRILTIDGGTITGAVSINCSPTISSGTSAPITTPAKIGNIFVDTAAHKLYFADGTASSANWVIAN